MNLFDNSYIGNDGCATVIVLFNFFINDNYGTSLHKPLPTLIDMQSTVDCIHFLVPVITHYPHVGLSDHWVTQLLVTSHVKTFVFVCVQVLQVYVLLQ